MSLSNFLSEPSNTYPNYPMAIEGIAKLCEYQPQKRGKYKVKPIN